MISKGDAMKDELAVRLDRIYSAIETAQEKDLTKFKPTIISTEKMVGYFQGFSGGQSRAEIQNAAQIMIHNVASLRDHLKKWAKKNGKNKDRVDAVLKASFPLSIIYDLWTVDKHGASGESWSGKNPHISEFYGVMKIMAPPGKAAVWMPTVYGNEIKGGGSACRVITGEIYDKDGTIIGHFDPMILEAVEEWEKLLIEFGVNLRG
jgi:hypothetical protein